MFYNINTRLIDTRSCAKYQISALNEKVIIEENVDKRRIFSAPLSASTIKIVPHPIHGYCHCGQFKIPVVSTCMSLGYVAMKNRVRLQAETTNLRASFSKYGGLMLWR